MTDTSTYTHDELSARLAEVERERDELSAMVGRLRERIEDAQGAMEMFDQGSGAMRDGWDFNDEREDIEKALAETPPAALAEIRAEAVEAAIKECKMLVLDGPNMHSECLADYAQQLRNGEVE